MNNYIKNPLRPLILLLALRNPTTHRGLTEQLHARWALADEWKLEARIVGDDAFEATQARSPGNPFPAERGALLGMALEIVVGFFRGPGLVATKNPFPIVGKGFDQINPGAGLASVAYAA